MLISSPTRAATTSTGLQPSDRVRLLPHLAVLRRDDRDIQLGVDADDAVVLADPDGSVTRLLQLMDGRCRLSELADLADQHGIAADRVHDLVATLAAAGLLRLTTSQTPGGTAISGPGASGVRLVGGGPVAGLIGEQLLRAGIGRLQVVDPDGTPWQPTVRVGRDRVQRAEHWSHPEIGALDLTVVSCATLEPDRAIAAELTAADHPHLFVRPRAQGAVIGPLVVPGRTSCLRCGDLSRTRTDSAWPRMLAQLCRTRGDWDPVAADWAAVVATTQILAHLTGRTVESASATLELGPLDWSWQRRLWRADPACGCCWEPRAEW